MIIPVTYEQAANIYKEKLLAGYDLLNKQWHEGWQQGLLIESFVYEFSINLYDKDGDGIATMLEEFAYQNDYDMSILQDQNNVLGYNDTFLAGYRSEYVPFFVAHWTSAIYQHQQRPQMNYSKINFGLIYDQYNNEFVY